MSDKKQDIRAEFMELYEPLHHGFVRFCTIRCYGVMEIDDLVQESILKVFQRYNSVSDKHALMAYLMRTAINIVNSGHRRRQVERSWMEDQQRKFQSMMPSAEVATDVRIVMEHLSALPEKYRRILELHEIIGYSIKEIAQMTNLSESNVKVRLHRSRKKLELSLSETPAEISIKLSSIQYMF